jgi:hypothetical protein
MTTNTRPQITKTTDGRTKITVTGQHGDQMSQGMNASETAALIYDLIATIPDSGLAQMLHIKAAG